MKMLVTFFVHSSLSLFHFFAFQMRIILQIYGIKIDTLNKHVTFYFVILIHLLSKRTLIPIAYL